MLCRVVQNFRSGPLLDVELCDVDLGSPADCIFDGGEEDHGSCCADGLEGLSGTLRARRSGLFTVSDARDCARMLVPGSAPWVHGWRRRERRCRIVLCSEGPLELLSLEDVC